MHFSQIVLENGTTILCGKPIIVGERLFIKFPDGHIWHGHTVSQCCGNGPTRMFIPVEFHGKKPWILLDEGMRAHRP